jgi:hypothetical protein
LRKSCKGYRIERQSGFLAERGAAQAELEIWGALKAGAFGGDDPASDPGFYNIRWFKQAHLTKVRYKTKIVVHFFESCLAIKNNNFNLRKN